MEKSNSVSNPIVPGCKLSKDEHRKAVDATIYKQMVGSLMDLTATRPDLMFTVCLISRYMEKLTEMHLQAAKRILIYLRGTMELRIMYKKGEGGELIHFPDIDYARDVDVQEKHFSLCVHAWIWSCLLVFKEAASGDFINYRS